MGELEGQHLHIDCFSGISGDMMLGALLDLGVPEEVVHAALAPLDLPGVSLHTSTVTRGGLVGRKVDVLHHGIVAGDAHGPVSAREHGDHAPHPHEHHHHVRYGDLRASLARHCQAPVARLALSIFDRIAGVEGKRHGVAPDDVVLHELGAVDSVADIVGIAAALVWLAPRSVSSRPVAVGGGSVRTAHGLLPVPAPATLELLVGCSIEAGGDAELTTPTGAAVLATLLGEGAAERFGPMPGGRVCAIGWGAGARDTGERPNLLRLVLIDRGEVRDHEHEVTLLEANIDDMSGELAAPLVEALLAAGAADAWLQPIVMKKGRPALLVSALVVEARRAAVEACLFRESSTLGVRRSLRARTILDREISSVETEWGAVAVKLGGRRGADGGWRQVDVAAPELDDCRRVAASAGVPLRRVYEAAAAAAQRLLSPARRVDAAKS